MRMETIWLLPPQGSRLNENSPSLPTFFPYHDLQYGKPCCSGHLEAFLAASESGTDWVFHTPAGIIVPVTMDAETLAPAWVIKPPGESVYVCAAQVPGFISRSLELQQHVHICEDLDKLQAVWRRVCVGECPNELNAAANGFNNQVDEAIWRHAAKRRAESTSAPSRTLVDDRRKLVLTAFDVGKKLLAQLA